MSVASATWRWISAFLAGLVALWAPAALAASACTVTPTLTPTFGPYSPPAVKAGAIPPLAGRAGLSCPTSVIVLISRNRLKATFHSANNLKLVRTGGTEAVGYAASADSAGTVAFTQDGTIDFMQNNLLNALGLLGGTAFDIPLYVRPSTTAALPPVGTYTDTITINWDWFQCTGTVSIGGLCVVGTLDSGTGTTTITVTLTVSAINGVTTSISTVTTWDPVNTTTFPKSLPGSRRRSTITLSNPDIVALDSNKLSVIVPTPAGVILALDGDGASSGAAIRFADGNPTSTLALTVGAPTDITDDVDFSSDNGATWTFYPQASDLASEAKVTHLRLRPRGAMAKQSSFSVSIPYLVKP